MSTQIPQRQTPLTDQVTEILLERISSGSYPPESRLPSEHELVEELGVSRATVRAALSALAAGGMVKRRQGVGTFVGRLTGISNPLNDVIDYHDLITGQGFHFGAEHLGAVIETPPPEVRQALGLEPDASVVEIKKAFKADGELVVYTVNFIPSWVYEDHLSPAEITRPGASEPLFEFMEARCRQPIDYYLANVRPEIARNIAFPDQVMPVDPLLPVLIVEETGYNQDEQAVIYEVEHLLGQHMQFGLIRRHHRLHPR